jgi:GTPase
MLHDRARIHLQAGAGGDGCVSLRREAHVPRGGPDGGDGGRGGDIVIVCDEALRDLRNFARKAHYAAARGAHGQGALRHGAHGQTLQIAVPPGTQLTGQDGDLTQARWELLRDGERVLIARGGSGGYGNKRFATPTRQTPRFAARGLPGQQGWLSMHLKLLADVGLVGLPNAGKSSLLGSLTRATPKVGSYPFTTLEPSLGVLAGAERQLVIADIPGLIEGASHGAGLGHEFLAHIERTRLLVHVLDIAPEISSGQDPDPQANFQTIEHELAAHDQRLAALPRILALSKIDLVSPERVRQALAQWQARLGQAVTVIATSAATGAGIRELAAQLLHSASAWSTTAAPAAEQAEPQLAEHMLFRPAAQAGFIVERSEDGRFLVDGGPVRRLLERFDLDNDDAMAYVTERLRQLGVIKVLQGKGFQPGDEVRIAGVRFDPAGRSPRPAAK